jgi:hypothetical protein
MEWIKGKPPGFGEDRVWIVAEIPSLFNPKLFSYKVCIWNGNSWSSKEVERATQWTILPLPKEDG